MRSFFLIGEVFGSRTESYRQKYSCSSIRSLPVQKLSYPLWSLPEIYNFFIINISGVLNCPKVGNTLQNHLSDVSLIVLIESSCKLGRLKITCVWTKWTSYRHWTCTTLIIVWIWICIPSSVKSSLNTLNFVGEYIHYLLQYKHSSFRLLLQMHAAVRGVNLIEFYVYFRHLV